MSLVNDHGMRFLTYPPPPPPHSLFPRTYELYQETEESSWEPPGIPFRPMTRDRRTGALIQAWPQLERELLEVGVDLYCHTFTVFHAFSLVRR